MRITANFDEDGNVTAIYTPNGAEFEVDDGAAVLKRGNVDQRIADHVRRLPQINEVVSDCAHNINILDKGQPSPRKLELTIGCTDCDYWSNVTIDIENETVEFSQE